jgi:hypothetical protein
MVNVTFSDTTNVPTYWMADGTGVVYATGDMAWMMM